jgi:hypothetical protein
MITLGWRPVARNSLRRTGWQQIDPSRLDENIEDNTVLIDRSPEIGTVIRYNISPNDRTRAFNLSGGEHTLVDHNVNYVGPESDIQCWP